MTASDPQGKAGQGGDRDEARRKFAHDARQPLNAIRLTATNLRLRLVEMLDPDSASWAAAKLEKIDRQVERLTELLDRLD